jgi:hypothetical protein
MDNNTAPQSIKVAQRQAASKCTMRVLFAFENEVAFVFAKPTLSSE